MRTNDYNENRREEIYQKMARYRNGSTGWARKAIAFILIVLGGRLLWLATHRHPLKVHSGIPDTSKYLDADIRVDADPRVDTEDRIHNMDINIYTHLSKVSDSLRIQPPFISNEGFKSTLKTVTEANRSNEHLAGTKVIVLGEVSQMAAPRANEESETRQVNNYSDQLERPNKTELNTHSEQSRVSTNKMLSTTTVAVTEKNSTLVDYSIQLERPNKTELDTHSEQSRYSTNKVLSNTTVAVTEKNSTLMESETSKNVDTLVENKTAVADAEENSNTPSTTSITNDVEQNTTNEVILLNDNKLNKQEGGNVQLNDTQSDDPKRPREHLSVNKENKGFKNEVSATNNDRNDADVVVMLIGEDVQTTQNVSKALTTDSCERIMPWGQMYHAKLSTYDLALEANHTIDKFGNYPIPVKTVPELTEDTDRDVVTVFLVPFSHADPGYGMTIEEYYRAKTHATLDNMIEKLTKYPNMTFQWAETVFLARWFQDLSETKQQQVRDLIVKGQLEIVLGGWVMPDEASTHYISVVDQMIEGHQWLLENLGVKPKQAWVNDPFGYSSTMPYLWKSTGMENMVFLRIDQAVKAQLMKRKSLEFNWRPYWKQSKSSDILATVMPYTNYWIGDVCGPNPAICNEFSFINMDKAGGSKVVEVTDDNVEKQSEIIYGQFLITADLYSYNSLYIGLGEDFSYSRPAEWDNLYTNYKKIIDYINSREDWKMKIKFGTLSEYFSNVRKEQEKLAKKALETQGDVVSKADFPSISGDFYPYTEKKQEYWTGYFTTRPLNKRFARELESLVRAADIFHVLTFSLFKRYWVTYGAYTDVTRDLQEARRELGMFLHHDGITGTSLPHVVRDYEQRLLKAHGKVQTAFKTILASLLSKGKHQQGKYLQEELVKSGPRQITQKIQIDTTKDKKVVLVNSFSQRRYEMVALCVNSPHIAIKSADQKAVPFQVNEWSATKNDNCKTTVTFSHELPPFGIEVLKLGPKSSSQHVETSEEEHIDVEADGTFMIENKFMKIEFDRRTGRMTRVTDQQGRVTAVSSQFLVYQSSTSGAYLFGPKGKALQFTTGALTITVARGQLVSEVRVKSPGLFISYKLFNTNRINGHGIHIKTEVDLAAVNMKEMEVILRFGTDVKNGIHFFTDQNGYQLMGRRRRTDMPIEANYYPVSTMMLIEDGRKRVSLHTKQAHGASSLEEGQFEVMLDRHTFRDDGRGLGQGVYDNVKVNGDFILHIEHIHTDGSSEPRYTFPTEDASLMNEMLQNTVFAYSVLDSSVIRLDKIHPLKQYQLPCDVSVVGLRNIVRNNLEYNMTSLVLHRKSFLCNHDNINNQCSNRNDTVMIKNILPKMKVKLTETSLSHLYDKTVLSSDSNILPDKMELRAFKLEFN